MNLMLIISIVVALVLVVLFLACLAIINYSGEEMVQKYNQIKNIKTSISAVELAQFVSKSYFQNRILFKFKDKMFCDAFSSNNTLTLSNVYAFDKNLAGLSICAHELGHAFQINNQSEKMAKYQKKLRLSKILSKFISPIIISALVLLFLEHFVPAIALLVVAVIFFIVALVAKISTIQIEKEASEIGIKILDSIANLNPNELETSRKFLNSAKLTYVADFLKTMLKWTGLTRK